MSDQVIWPSDAPTPPSRPRTPAVSSFELVGTPPAGSRRTRTKLDTPTQVANELASVYRQMKNGTLDPTVGTKLAFVLAQLGRLREVAFDEQLAERLGLIDGKGQR